MELAGEWQEAEAAYRRALELSEKDTTLRAQAQCALGKLYRLRGDYAVALDWLAWAVEDQGEK